MTISQSGDVPNEAEARHILFGPISPEWKEACEPVLEMLAQFEGPLVWTSTEDGNTALVPASSAKDDVT